MGVDGRGWGPAANTVDRGSQLSKDDEDDEDDEEDEEEEERRSRRRSRRRRRRRRQLINQPKKSHNFWWLNHHVPMVSYGFRKYWSGFLLVPQAGSALISWWNFDAGALLWAAK